MIRLEKRSPMFQELSFVLRARATDTIKPCYNHLYVEKEEDKTKLICTDARRLHMLTIEDDDIFQAGFYEVVKHNKSELIINFIGNDNFQFPNYRQTMPDLSGMTKTSEFAVSVKRFTETAIIYRDFYKNFPNCSVCFMPEFLDDALITGYVPSISFVDSIAKNKSLYDVPMRVDYTGNMTAVIMPLLKF